MIDKETGRRRRVRVGRGLYTVPGAAALVCLAFPNGPSGKAIGPVVPITHSAMLQTPPTGISASLLLRRSLDGVKLSRAFPASTPTASPSRCPCLIVSGRSFPTYTPGGGWPLVEQSALSRGVLRVERRRFALASDATACSVPCDGHGFFSPSIEARGWLQAENTPRFGVSVCVLPPLCHTIYFESRAAYPLSCFSIPSCPPPTVGSVFPFHSYTKLRHCVSPCGDSCFCQFSTSPRFHPRTGNREKKSRTLPSASTPNASVGASGERVCFATNRRSSGETGPKDKTSQDFWPNQLLVSSASYSKITTKRRNNDSDQAEIPTQSG